MDPMHIVDLGIWGHHLLTSIAVLVDETLASYGILRRDAIVNAWKEIPKRAEELEPDITMCKLNHFKANYMHHLLKHKRNPKDVRKRNMAAWEHQLLMLVSPCNMYMYSMYPCVQ